MKDKKLENGIKEIKNIKMTDLEKNHILDYVLNTHKEYVHPVKSPWSMDSLVFLLKKNQLAYYIIIPLIVILSGGGVVFASQDSLPNDILYPIKVKILEPVEGALIFSQTEKAKHQSNLAKARLIEAQILAKEGNLDNDTEEKINKLLLNHTVALDNAINKANKDNSKKEVENITTDFRAEMNANARILDVINEKENSKKQEKDSSRPKIEEENDNKGSYDLSKTARTSADSIKDSIKEKKTDNEYYKDKKEKLKYLIEDRDKDDLLKETESSLDKDNFKDDTHKKIDEAKKYLEEADKKEKEGDDKEAHSLLLDSESSLKEALILSNSKISFDEEDEDEK